MVAKVEQAANPGRADVAPITTASVSVQSRLHDYYIHTCIISMPCMYLYIFICNVL